MQRRKMLLLSILALAIGASLVWLLRPAPVPVEVAEVERGTCR